MGRAHHTEGHLSYAALCAKQADVLDPQNPSLICAQKLITLFLTKEKEGAQIEGTQPPRAANGRIRTQANLDKSLGKEMGKAHKAVCCTQTWPLRTAAADQFPNVVLDQETLFRRQHSFQTLL